MQAQTNSGTDAHGSQHGPNAKRVRLAPPGHPGQVNAQTVAMQTQQQQQQDFHQIQQQQQQIMFNNSQQPQQQNFPQRF